MQVPPLLVGLVDDAAILPPSNMTLSQALDRFRSHRLAWYRDLIGPWLLPASRLEDLPEPADRPKPPVDAPNPSDLPGAAPNPSDPSVDAASPLAIGLVCDAGPAPQGLRALVETAAAIPGDLVLRHIEVPVAMRNQDPMPGLQAVLDLEATGELPLDGDGTVYAEIPLTWGLLASLDRLTAARASGARVAPKFRTGGLAAELFPTPVELAAVICACRDRQLPFKLAAGAHRAIRRTDPETGLVTHGFLNILGAVLAAADGAEPVDLAEILGGTDPLPVVAAVRSGLAAVRPLWTGFGSGNPSDVLSDLRALGLLPPVPASA